MARSAQRSRSWCRLWGLALALYVLAVTAAPAGAEQRADPAAVQPSAWPEIMTLEEAARFLRVDSRELEDLALRGEVPVRRIGTAWRFSPVALLAWLGSDWKPGVTALPPSVDYPALGAGLDQATPGGAKSLAPPAMARVTGTGTTLTRRQASPPSEEEPPKEPIGEAPDERSADEVFLREQRVLLAPGDLTFDIGLFYSESDSQQLVFIDGDLGLATIERRAFTTLVLGRLGLFKETEFFASTTYRIQDSDVFLGEQKLSGTSRSGFGDVRLGLRHTVLKEGPGLPNVIITFDGRLPTGDTSYAAGGGITLVKSVDPAVLFATANYHRSFSRNFVDVTRLEPRDRFGLTMGYALALNDTLTLSTVVLGLFTGATRFDNAQLRAQQAFSLQLGLTSRLARGLYIEPTVTFGLSGPGRSFAVGVTMPYAF